MECDTVIMSLGTSQIPPTTIGLDTNKRKCIVATEDTGATSKEGVFAGGDDANRCCNGYSCHGCRKSSSKGY